MSPGKRFILCAEDNEDISFLLRTLLEQSDVRVEIACSASEALMLARSIRFALFILDSRLQDGSGLDVCREIRKFDTQTPILFYSGLASETARQLAFDAGAQAYLIKPDNYILVRTVKHFLSHADDTPSLPSQQAVMECSSKFESHEDKESQNLCSTGRQGIYRRRVIQ